MDNYRKRLWEIRARTPRRLEDRPTKHNRIDDKDEGTCYEGPMQENSRNIVIPCFLVEIVRRNFDDAWWELDEHDEFRLGELLQKFVFTTEAHVFPRIHVKKPGGSGGGK